MYVYVCIFAFLLGKYPEVELKGRVYICKIRPNCFPNVFTVSPFHKQSILVPEKEFPHQQLYCLLSRFTYSNTRTVVSHFGFN